MKPRRRPNGIWLAAGAAGAFVAAVGLAIMALLPPSPPDASFTARIEAWRRLPPTPRPSRSP